MVIGFSVDVPVVVSMLSAQFIQTLTQVQCNVQEIDYLTVIIGDNIQFIVLKDLVRFFLIQSAYLGFSLQSRIIPLSLYILLFFMSEINLSPRSNSISTSSHASAESCSHGYAKIWVISLSPQSSIGIQYRFLCLSSYIYFFVRNMAVVLCEINSSHQQIFHDGWVEVTDIKLQKCAFVYFLYY